MVTYGFLPCMEDLQEDFEDIQPTASLEFFSNHTPICRQGFSMGPHGPAKGWSVFFCGYDLKPDL